MKYRLVCPICGHSKCSGRCLLAKATQGMEEANKENT